MNKERITRWFYWSSLGTEKVESWLEQQASQGWHLVKADRALLRFHFERGEPKTVRYCVDYPHEVNDEYKTIFEDAGWKSAGHSGGWYIWQIEYTGTKRPELFNDVQPLIERNNRLLIVFFAALVAQVGLIPSVILGYFPTPASVLGKMTWFVYGLLVLVLAFFTVATYRQNVRLKKRKM